MLLEAERAKDAVCIDAEDLFRRSIGKERNCDRNQPPHKVGIAVAAIVQGDLAVACSPSA